MSATLRSSGVSKKTVRELIRKARVLVFDFDGTLVDSNPIKHRAFEVCFSDFPEQIDRIMDYCAGNPHVTRGEKFRFVYSKILKRPLSSAAERQLHRCYAAETTERVIQAPEVPFAESFLESIGRTHETGLLSSTPQLFLRKIVARRGWNRYFDFIRGAPVRKASWLKKLRKDRELKNGDLIYFGDTPEDEKAAREARCLYIGVRTRPKRSAQGAFLRDFSMLISKRRRL